jgi:hypothetical protein
MSNKPIPPQTPEQQEHSVSLWERIQHDQQADEMLESDEVSGMILPFDGAGTHPGSNVPPLHVQLERLIDAAIWADRRIDEADAIRIRAIARRDRYRARADRYRGKIKELLDYMELTAWEANEGSASFAKGRASVEITDLDKLEAQRPDLVKVETIKTPDKIAIRDAIKALGPDETLEGAEMSTPAPVLRITPF